MDDLDQPSWGKRHCPILFALHSPSLESIENLMKGLMEIKLPAGPTISFLISSTSVSSDVGTEPMNMMRSFTFKCRRAFPVADRLYIGGRLAGVHWVRRRKWLLANPGYI
jgi:hypothetical protein